MGKKIDKKTLSRIKFLRRHGYSLPEISNITKIPKTTVFRHIKGLEVLPKFRNEWLGKRGGSRRIKLLKEAGALKDGKKIINKLTEREKMLFLSALYWAEGSKADFGLSNTDPNLIKVFMYVLRHVLKISDTRIKPSIRIYEDIDKEKALAFWSNTIKISKENFVNVNILRGKKTGKLKYGMCRIRVSKGGDLLKKIKGINTAFANIV